MSAPPTALLIVPASNTTVEPEMAALLPGFARQFTARVPNPAKPLTAADIPAYADRTIEATTPYLQNHPTVAAHCCTAAGFLAGPEGNRLIVERLRTHTGIPVISTADAMVAALRHSGASRVAVLTPYLKPVNDGLRHYLEAGGVTVATLDSFECPTVADLCRVTDDQVMDRALGLTTAPGASYDALFIACSQLPTLAILQPLRERLRIPVWSSISATAWSVAHLSDSRAIAA